MERGRMRGEENGSFFGDEPTQEIPLGPIASSAGRRVARLVVLEGRQPGREWTLGARATIGRGMRAEIALEDRLVSRNHAVISQDEAGWLVRDLGSRNGTLVNGRRIDVERLRCGDRITVGQTVLVFTDVDRVRERLLERQKIETFGHLCAGVVHDLNNHFAAILAALEYLEGTPRDLQLADPEVRECLDDARGATRRAAELTARLLAWTRRDLGEYEVIDVSALCEGTVEIARRILGRSVRIELALEKGLAVRGDRCRLHQVVFNLLLNARDAMPRGGTVRISAALVSESPGQEANHPQIRLVVEDTGTGIDEATRARIFEPFFTTKSLGQGTGLGLTIVRDVVRAHGGTIECDSAPGRGTRFTILLPAAAPESTCSKTQTPVTRFDPEGKLRGTVLVVDDDPIERRTIRRLLELAGMKVLEAADDLRALEVVREADPPVDIVLFGLDASELDRSQAYRELRATAPRLPVVILSGLCDESHARRIEDEGAGSVLSTPFDSAALLGVIQAALARGPS
jgi:signal transduction histidine kinase